ncbi:MAG: hypothetical protein P8P30_01320 [Rickettsiales bacterium]|nr:hypothetical protein [Rickettsiales bacterium]
MARFIQPKNKLKEKLGDGGIRKVNIARAEKGIEEFEVDFTPIAAKYLVEIRGSLSKKDQIDRSKMLDCLVQLRAQGAFFQFKSITAITDILVDLLDSLNDIDDTILQIVNSYEQATQVLIKMNIKDDQNETCNALVVELNTVCQKYKSQHNII